VEPGVPAFLHELEPRGKDADRLDLARWIVDPQNPLMPRATVNRFWKHLFGRGLVNTVENLGISGETPSHPDLLDWLATELIARNWSRKEMLRLIVMSASYRQTSDAAPKLLEKDPYNVLLARQSRFRVEAEVVRDLALSASGLLNPKVGGPSVRPPMDKRLTSISRNQDWEVSQGGDQYRRGMYILFRRGTPYPLLTLFDAPDSTVSCSVRERSNSPLQALTLLNDPVFFECAQELGRQLASLGDVDSEEWISAAFVKCLARFPEPAELARLVQQSREQRQLLDDVSSTEIKRLTGESVPEIDPREHAVRIMVARSLMNLDEFITRE
jgi:hypothetical protein